MKLSRTYCHHCKKGTITLIKKDESRVCAICGRHKPELTLDKAVSYVVLFLLAIIILGGALILFYLYFNSK